MYTVQCKLTVGGIFLKKNPTLYAIFLAFTGTGSTMKKVQYFAKKVVGTPLGKIYFCSDLIQFQSFFSKKHFFFFHSEKNSKTVFLIQYNFQLDLIFSG